MILRWLPGLTLAVKAFIQLFNGFSCCVRAFSDCLDAFIDGIKLAA